MTDHLPAPGKMVDLDRLQALHEAATPGPWARRGDVSIEADPDGFTEVLIPGAVRCGSYCLGGSSDIEVESADLDLIVAMRNALPSLLAEVRALRAERDRTDAALQEMCSYYVEHVHDDDWGVPVAYSIDDKLKALGLWREPKETP